MVIRCVFSFHRHTRLYKWCFNILAGAVPTNDLYIEDIEVPCGQPMTTRQLVTKVHVQNIPQEFRNIGLQYYLERVMQGEASCKVELFDADGIATFHPQIGIFTIVKF